MIPSKIVGDPTANTTRRGKGIVRITWITLLILFLVNFVYAGFLAISHDKASGDALSYYALAVNLHEGQGFSRDYKSDLNVAQTNPPFQNQGRFLYPAFVSLVFQAFSVSVGTANLVAAFFKALLVIPTVLIAKYLFADDLTGLVAGLIYTINPAYIALGTIAMPATTTALFYYLSIILLLRYYQTKRRALITLAGLALSLSYLARPEGLLLIVLGIVIIALGSRRWRDVVYLFIFPVLTMTLGNVVIYGRMGNVSPYQTPLTVLPDWADYYVLGGFSLPAYLDRMGGLFGALAVRVYNCLLFLKHTFADGLWFDRRVGLLPFTFIPVLVLAFLRPVPSRERVYLYLLSGFVVAQFVLTIGYPGYPRMSADYRHGQIIGPFLIVLAAAGLVYLWQGCKCAQKQITGRVLCKVYKVIGLLLTVQYLVFSVVFLSLGLNDTLWVPRVREPLVEASEWIRDNLPSESVIMSRKPVVTNYVSQRTSIIIPTAPYADIVEYAQQHGVTHFLMTDLERSGLPNLKQGLEVYADHFQNVYTTGTFAIVKVKSYDYDARPSVEDDWYVGRENVRRHLYDWGDLWEFNGSHAFEDAWDVWSQWFIRIKKNAWSLAKDREVPAPMEYPVGARLGDGVLLMGYDLNMKRVRPSDTVELTLYWRSLQPVDTDYTVFTHALDENGMVRAQQDNPPINGTHPTSRWAMGETIRDRYTLTFAPDSPKGKYMIEVGMYDGQTGERLPVYDETGQELPDRRVLVGPIKVR